MSDFDSKRRRDEDDFFDDFEDLEFITTEDAKDYTTLEKKQHDREERAEDGRSVSRSRNNNKKKKSSFSLKKLIILVVVVIVAIVVVRVVVKNVRTNMQEQQAQEQAEEQADDLKQTEVEILAANYYNAYAQGDEETIATYAYPMTALENSYMTMMAEYVESYENIACTLYDGPTEDTYFVMVETDVKYADIETTSPQVDLFYVAKNESGAYYISNAYSSFNRNYSVSAVNSAVQTSFESFENDTNVVTATETAAQGETDAKAADEALNTLLSETIPNAVSSWESKYADNLTTAQEAVVAAASESTDESAEDQADSDAAAQESITAAAEESDESEDSSDESSEESSEESSDESTDDSSDDSSSSSSEVTEKKASGLVYTTDTIYIRKKPSKNAKVVASATKGSELIVKAKTSNGWYKIKTGDVVGYVKQKYTTKKKPSS